MPQPLCADLCAKVLEQIERIQHLADALPPESLDWEPPIERPWSTRRLLAHLVPCLAGFCAVLHAAQPVRLAHFQALRDLPLGGEPDLPMLLSRIELFGSRIAEGFAALEDSDLEKVVPTVFVPSGESILTLLLGNFEHLVNHKHQLFSYLRWMGVDVKSEDLYRFRGTIQKRS